VAGDSQSWDVSTHFWFVCALLTSLRGRYELEAHKASLRGIRLRMEAAKDEHDTTSGWINLYIDLAGDYRNDGRLGVLAFCQETEDRIAAVDSAR
jgi:hypothetical protein